MPPPTLGRALIFTTVSPTARLTQNNHPTNTKSLMRRSNFTRTTLLPMALLVYLAVLAWLARGRFYSGDYLYYFGVIGGSLVIIGLLYLALRRRDRLRRQWDEEQQYGSYAEKEKDSSEADDKHSHEPEREESSKPT